MLYVTSYVDLYLSNIRNWFVLLDRYSMTVVNGGGLVTLLVMSDIYRVVYWSHSHQLTGHDLQLPIMYLFFFVIFSLMVLTFWLWLEKIHRLSGAAGESMVVSFGALVLSVRWQERYPTNCQERLSSGTGGECELLRQLTNSEQPLKHMPCCMAAELLTANWSWSLDFSVAHFFASPQVMLYFLPKLFRNFCYYWHLFLLACLMGQYCFAR